MRGFRSVFNLSLVALAFTFPSGAFAQPRGDNMIAAPNRRPDEGKGPFKTLVIRGGMLIDGTGGPPRGPVDIVIEGNHISSVRPAGTPGLPLAPDRNPKGAEFEVDATGMYIMPGFVDLHVHGGAKPKNEEIEYAYKLWLAHGVTTVRGVPLTDHDFAVKEKARSERNEIVAPRIWNYQRIGQGWGKPAPDTPEAARDYVRWAAA
ncbi:MAG: amidohydrolase, partial [Vicinamibacteria bacterium]